MDVSKKRAVEILMKQLNVIVDSKKMPEDWRKSILVPMFKHKDDVQSCRNYRGIKLMNHTMTMWERVMETRLREEVMISEQHCGFMPRKYCRHQGQKELHCVFVVLEKPNDRVPRQEL